MVQDTYLLSLQLDSLHKSDDGKGEMKPLAENSASTNGAQPSAFEGEEGVNRGNSDTNILVPNEGGQNGGQVSGSHCVEPTVPHGSCKDTASGSPGGILHPGGDGTEPKSEVSIHMLCVECQEWRTIQYQWYCSWILHTHTHTENSPQKW